MRKYQVVYSNGGFPLSYWTANKATARKFAHGRRCAGYEVDVWSHTLLGSRLLNI